MNAACTGARMPRQTTKRLRRSAHRRSRPVNTRTRAPGSQRKGQDVFYLGLHGEERARQDRGAHPMRAVLRQLVILGGRRALAGSDGLAREGTQEVRVLRQIFGSIRQMGRA